MRQADAAHAARRRHRQQRRVPRLVRLGAGAATSGLVGTFGARAPLRVVRAVLPRAVRQGEKLPRARRVRRQPGHAGAVLGHGVPHHRRVRVRVPTVRARARGVRRHVGRQRGARLPAVESAPFYYWSGNITKKNLTANNIDKHLLLIGLERPEDYEQLPILNSNFSKSI